MTILTSLLRVRTKLINVGKTNRGFDWEIALISSPENLAKLDQDKEIHAAWRRDLAWTRQLRNGWHARARCASIAMAACISTEVAGAQPGSRNTAEYVRKLRKVAEDLRTTEFETTMTLDALLEKYQLAGSERQLSSTVIQ